MSAIVPNPAGGLDPEPDHPVLRQRPLDVEEQRTRWRIRAAQWRARQLAEAAFGPVARSDLVAMRPGGDFEGLLHLDVPFRSLEDHRRREALFLAAAGEDPILSSVPLLYVVGPDAA